MIKSILKFETMKFPCGEMHVRIDASQMSWFREAYPSMRTSIEFEFTKNEDIIELMLFVDALYRLGIAIDTLKIPYVPFSRQDRVAVRGECFSLMTLASIVNGCGAKEVLIFDPHSDVTPALIKNCHVIHQYEIFCHYFAHKKDYWLICPDGGALKKIYKLAEHPNVKAGCLGVIECGKRRNVETGEIEGIRINFDYFNGGVGNADCYIVDDICDGGGTFIRIAEELRKKKVGKIVLMVTHGFFTKGLDVFDGLIDEIYTWKGRVK